MPQRKASIKESIAYLMVQVSVPRSVQVTPLLNILSIRGSPEHLSQQIGTLIRKVRYGLPMRDGILHEQN